MKVFCIGFNKTGTTSLHALFKSLGLRSHHGMYSEWDVSDPRFDEYDCFSDGNHHDFIQLDKKFPNSKFILTSRRLDNWLISRIRHIEIRRVMNKTGWMRKEYEANPRRAIERWTNFRAPYNERVFSYFADRSADLLCLNICESHNPKEDVANLLKFLDRPVDSELKFPHERSTDNITNNMGGGIRNLIRRKNMPRSKEEIRNEVECALEELRLPKSDWQSDGLCHQTNTNNHIVNQAGTASIQK